MPSKKPQKQEQEQPAEQPPAEEEPYKPMATPEPTLEEQVASLKLRVDQLENTTMKHQRYHFGGYSQD